MAEIMEAGDLIKRTRPTATKKKVGIRKRKRSESTDVEETPKKRRTRKTSEKKPVRKRRAKVESEEKKPTRKKRTTVNTKSKSRAVKKKEEQPDTEALTSEFDEIYGKHIDALSVEDQEQLQEYFTMFRKLQKIARRFETKSIEGSSKDVYALMKVYDQMREIIADLKALKDVSQIADRLQEDILLPYSRVMVAELANIRSSVVKTGNRLLPAENQKEYVDQVNSAFIAASQKLEEGYTNARTAILDIYAE